MTSAAQQEQSFRPSRFTIRVKLLLFVGTLLAVALSGMVLVATLLFRETIETQIQEYNLSLARLIGKKLGEDFRNVAVGLNAVFQNEGGARSSAALDRFFQSHSHVFYVGRITFTNAERSNYLITSGSPNATFLRSNRLSPTFVEELTNTNRDRLQAPKPQQSVIRLHSKQPLKLLAMFAGDGPGRTTGWVVYLEAAGLLDAFQAAAGADLFELYLVDAAGQTLASTAETPGQAMENRRDEPIVAQLLSARLDNGSRRYAYKGMEYLASFQAINFAKLGVVSRVPAGRAFEAVSRLQRRNGLIMVMVLSGAFVFLYFFARGMAVPIRRLVRATKEVEEGRYQLAIEPATRDEIGMLTTSFVAMARGLEDRDRLQSEMDVAERIQTALLPERSTLAGHEVSALMLPAEEVGGDYYDLIETAAGETWLAIGDVSGHGVESGLIQMMTQTSIFSIVDAEANLSPAVVLKRVNRVMRENIARLGAVRYVTLTLLRLDGNRLTFAGKHEDILIHRAATGNVEVVETKGSWIGISEALGEFLEDDSIELQPGDTVLFYTDGLTEAVTESMELYGEQRLQQSFDRHASASLGELQKALIADVQQYQDRQRDDFTVLLLRFRSRAPEPRA